MAIAVVARCYLNRSATIAHILSLMVSLPFLSTGRRLGLCRDAKFTKVSVVLSRRSQNRLAQGSSAHKFRSNCQRSALLRAQHCSSCMQWPNLDDHGPKDKTARLAECNLGA
ncbi:hypothetical protein LY76DRAFT_19417 [Colletotrichum caudatum]|nr:hypothetical protein LY76DRAFT_19417 [Colletotrichum caudatum]